jgi:hypothetical protein
MRRFLFSSTLMVILLLAVMPATALSGKVVTETQQPFPGATVCYMIPGGRGICVETDDAGDFTLPDSITDEIMVTAEGHIPITLQTITVREPIVLKQAASLRVRLVSADTGDTGDTNDALDHGELFLIFPSGKRQGPFPVGSAGVIINRLAPGRYRLLGSVDGFVQHVAVSADLLGGEQTESEIPLHNASSASN